MFFDNLEEFKDKFNENQRLFFQHTKYIFDKVAPRLIAAESRITYTDETLLIYIVHNTDPSTFIELKVDKYEIYITCAGYGRSLYLVFPKLNGIPFYEKVAEYVEDALRGEYHKIDYFEKGKKVETQIFWNNNKYKKITYGGLWIVIKKLLLNPKLTVAEYHYSSFIE